MAELKPAVSLGVSGRRVWRQVVREATNDGLELDSREQFWLLSAAKLADQLAILETEMANQPLLVKGSMGQPVPNGLLAEIRSHHHLIAQLLARLKVDVPEASGVLGVVGANKARGAANARWRPGGGA
jgi:hypothetical protein